MVKYRIIDMKTFLKWYRIFFVIFIIFGIIYFYMEHKNRHKTTHDSKNIIFDSVIIRGKETKSFSLETNK